MSTTPVVMLKEPGTKRRRAFGLGEVVIRRRGIWMTRLILAVVTLGLWELASGPVVDPFFVSSPTEVAAQLNEWAVSGDLTFHLSITVQELLLGFVLGAALGVVCGIVIGLLPYVSEVLQPFIVSFYSVPKIALMPLFIVWFGLGMLPKVLLAMIGVFFVVFFSTLTGVRNVSADLINVLKIMGASRRQVIAKVILPAAAGWVFSGLRISLPQAFIGAVAGELLASNRGLGYLIQDSAGLFNTAGVFAGVLLLIATAWMMSILLDVVEARMGRRSAAVPGQMQQQF